MRSSPPKTFSTPQMSFAVSGGLNFGSMECSEKMSKEPIIRNYREIRERYSTCGVLKQCDS